MVLHTLLRGYSDQVHTLTRLLYLIPPNCSSDINLEKFSYKLKIFFHCFEKQISFNSSVISWICPEPHKSHLG